MKSVANNTPLTALSLSKAPTASQAPLRAPPSRPIRPPTANTPSPDTHSLQSTPPRPRPRAATMSNPQPPSRPKTVKKYEIQYVITQKNHILYIMF